MILLVILLIEKHKETKPYHSNIFYFTAWLNYSLVSFLFRFLNHFFADKNII